MQLHRFRHKRHKAKKRNGLCITYMALFFTIFVCYKEAYTQDLVSTKIDTLMQGGKISATLETNNGSLCICSISNISKSQIATVVNIGDTQNVKFTDSSAFNGVHMLATQKQIIAVADFKGSQLIVSNLSPYKIVVIVTFICPKDEE